MERRRIDHVVESGRHVHAGRVLLRANRAYLYAVMARDGNGAYAPISNSDLATTIGFTDDPLLPKVTRIRALHFTELRNAINAVRTLAGLQPYTYSSAPAIGALMRPEHIAEMRSALAPALTAMNLPQPAYTNTTITPGILVKASHVQELRNVVK